MTIGTRFAAISTHEEPTLVEVEVINLDDLESRIFANLGGESQVNETSLYATANLGENTMQSQLHLTKIPIFNVGSKDKQKQKDQISPKPNPKKTGKS